MLHHIALVGKHLVVGLRGRDEVWSCPVLPVYEVARDGECIEGIVLTFRIVGREVEHNIQIIHPHDLCIAGDDAGGLVVVDGVGGVALPPLQVVAQGDAYALGLELVGGVDASGVVEHQEAILAQLVRQPTRRLPSFILQLVDGALILCELLPPLGVLVADGEQGAVLRLPLVGLGDVATGPGQSDVQRLADGLIARAVAADVGHPVPALILAQLIAAVPCPVDERRESAPLVHVPAAVLVREDAPPGLPVQQVVARRQPRLVAATVEPLLAVVDHIGHQPLLACAEYRRTVYLVVVVRGCHYHAILIRRAHLVIDALHDVVGNVSSKCAAHCKER